MAKNISKKRNEYINNSEITNEEINKDIKTTQLKDSVDISTDKNIIDKKKVNDIIKNEKRQLKELKKQEILQEKERKKKRDKRINELIKARKKEERQRRKEQEEIVRQLEKRGKISSWFRLDNAASIYPSAASKDWNFVYRISAVTKEPVNPVLLQTALDDIMPRFPSFNVKIRHGFFWNYYERNFNRLKVEREKDFPCKPFDLNDSESFLIRVLYNDNKIIYEAFHAIADGRGSLFFFNSLIARYLELKGVEIKEYTGCSSYLDLPNECEVEDSFLKCATKEKIGRPKERAAYKLKGDVLPAGIINCIEGEMSVKEVKEVAKRFGVSISTFLSALVGYCVYKKRRNNKKPVRISVPIDLRSFFESKTLRNFSSYMNVEINGDNLTFEQVVEIFKTQIQGIDKRFLQGNINANTGAQKNFFVKIMPLFIKNIVLKACFNYMGENYQTLSVSNLGRVIVPEEFSEHIESYDVNLGRSRHNEKGVAIISYGDKLNMCISSKVYDTETERDILKMLAELGISVTIYSNRRDLYGIK